MDVLLKDGKWVPFRVQPGGLQVQEGKKWVDHVPPAGVPVATDCSDLPSMTRQSEAEACDINFIMRRYEQTGIPPEFRPGDYLDVSEMPDYRTALDQIEAARALFGKMPLAVRKAFNQDPAEFLDQIGNPDRRKEFEDLGLFEQGKAVDTPVVPGATDKPPASA